MPHRRLDTKIEFDEVLYIFTFNLLNFFKKDIAHKLLKAQIFIPIYIKLIKTRLDMLIRKMEGVESYI
jgi:hypothetical protein